MLTTKAPTDQRAGVRPIAFVLQKGGSFGTPVTLKVRPEDLTRTEPSRIAVTQTLGREVIGWSDNFGAGLPTVNISGHTGWRTSAGSGEDGAEAFETLNTLIMEEYHQAKQAAVDAGTDPATVKLLFVDMLDDFVYSVAPMQFVLRRSKNRPLLFQYNIQMQAISTSIDTQFQVLPFFGSFGGGKFALGGVLGKLVQFAKTVQGWVAKAIAFKDKVLAPIAATVKTFMNTVNIVLSVVNSVVDSAKALVTSTVKSVVAIAKDLASVGLNLFRTITNIANLPSDIKAEFGKIGSAFNEVICIFSNALRPGSGYEEFDGIYGASNCSSTTGGRPISAFTNSNVFGLMQPGERQVMVTSDAYSAIQSVKSSDPVLAPMPIQEIGRNLTAINDGVRLAA